MRRGLMKWDPRELPLELLEARIGRLRAQMADAEFDGFVIYTNNVRPSAVQYLTGFTPYWSEGLLLVPKSGRPVFATALSNRVVEWIKATNRVSEVVSTPRPGTLVGERLANGAASRRIAVLELDAMPAELFGDAAAAAPTVSWLDGSSRFEAVRRRLDTAERALLKRADALAAMALDEVGSADHPDAGTLAGLIEERIRLAGAEEVYVAVAPDLAADRRLNRVSQPAPLAGRFAVRASVAYKGSWIRRTRTYVKGCSTGAADVWFEKLIGGLQAGIPLVEQISTHLRTLPGATLKSWMAEGCIGSYPLAVIASSRMPGRDVSAGNFFVLTVELSLAPGPWLGTASFIAGA